MIKLQLVLKYINDLLLIINSFDFLLFGIFKTQIGDILKAPKNETEAASISLVEQL